MQRIIDISLPLAATLPVWPGSTGLRLTRTTDIERGDAVTNSRLDCDVHTGTHVDAPAHFLAAGRTVEALPLDALLGPALVVHLPDALAITAETLEQACLPTDLPRVLFRTQNSKGWSDGVTEFNEDFVALTADAAEWLVARGVRLVGVDYLSVQRYHDGPRTHSILLGADVVVLEGLDLSRAEAGRYELICLPLPLVGAEGAPARAVLRQQEAS